MSKELLDPSASRPSCLRPERDAHRRVARRSARSGICDGEPARLRRRDIQVAGAGEDERRNSDGRKDVSRDRSASSCAESAGRGRPGSRGSSRNQSRYRHRRPRAGFLVRRIVRDVEAGRPSRVSTSSIDASALLERGRPRIVVRATCRAIRPTRTSARERSGYVAAKSDGHAARLPSAQAMRRSLAPTASSTARTSSIRCSSVGSRSFETRSDIPVPRLSNRIRRENDARRSRKRAGCGFSHWSTTFETQPGT